MDKHAQQLRLDFLDLGPEDAERLRTIQGEAHRHADEVIDRLYEHLLRFEQTHRYFPTEQILARVKEHQRAYFLRLTEGAIDEAYFENRLKTGDAHQKIELRPEWYLGLYSLYLRLTMEMIFQNVEMPRAFDVVSSLIKLIFLDIGLAIDAYIQGGFMEKLVEERKTSDGLREELARKERLAMLGQLAGGVGHELRNPMAAIQMSVYYLSMALEGGDSKVRKHLGILEKELANANEIIANLLDFSRVKEPRRRKVSLSDLVRESLERQAFAGIETDLQLRDVEVHVDPAQMRQVILNLVTNAIQAMTEHGGGGVLRISTSTEAGFGCLSVEDTGGGIEEEILGKIFQPLFTTRARGIGLGLAVTEQLVQANSGTIRVSSEKGKGSRFTVVLPLNGH